jgi:integrase
VALDHRRWAHRVRAAPRPVAGEREAEAKGHCVRAVVAALQALVSQIVNLTSACEQALAKHADAEVVTPLFREGRLCAAQLLAELGDDRGRYVSADHLAAEGGVAPVTRASGRHRAVSFRLQHDRGKLRVDPRSLFPKFKGKYIPKTRHLTRAEFEMVLRTLAPARRLWLALAVFSGARLSEVEGVCWETVDLENRRLLLPGTKTSKARRWVPIAEPLHRLLSEIHEDARSGPVLPPWRNVRRDLAALVTAHNKAQAKLAQQERRPAPKPMDPNDLRRTFASWLKQAGVDSMVVAKLLGHTTSRMVEFVYGHLNDATTQAAIAKLPAATVPPLATQVPRKGVQKQRRYLGVLANVEPPTLGLPPQKPKSSTETPKVRSPALQWSRVGETSTDE